jgi:hypothetical protein
LVFFLKKKLGRFIDDAQYVLVIVTDKAIHIFGLSNTPTGIVFHDMSSDRYRANYSKKNVESIIGTEDGRIFLIDAGELCELVYEVNYYSFIHLFIYFKAQKFIKRSLVF